MASKVIRPKLLKSCRSPNSHGNLIDEGRLFSKEKYMYDAQFDPMAIRVRVQGCWGYIQWLSDKEDEVVGTTLED
jgi:hypothetical protein